MRRFHEEFRFCPRCGAAYDGASFDPADSVYRCGGCRFAFYQNSIPSATVVVPRAGAPHEVVLIVRENEPQKGLLSLPGGFLRYGEDPREGALREAREEAGVDVVVERLLYSTLIDYEYLGSRLWALELAFLAKPLAGELKPIRNAETRDVGFHDARDLVRDPARLAFPEQAKVLAAYLD